MPMALVWGSGRCLFLPWMLLGLLGLCTWWAVAGTDKSPAVFWSQSGEIKGNQQRVGVGGLGPAQRFKTNDGLRRGWSNVWGGCLLWCIKVGDAGDIQSISSSSSCTMELPFSIIRPLLLSHW